jgi:hypothetical protein
VTIRSSLDRCKVAHANRGSDGGNNMNAKLEIRDGADQLERPIAATDGGPDMIAKLEIRDCADQLEHPALQLIAARPDIFNKCGHIAASYRRRNGKTFGPYYRLV